MAVTMPKLPPPPRTAQKRSASRCGVGDDDAPVGGHDLHGADAVGGEAVLAGEPAQAAAEAVADDADVVRRAGQRGEPVLGGGADDVGPQRAGLGAGAAAVGVDLDDRACGAS